MLAATAQESELTASLEREKHLETKCEQMNNLISKLRESQSPVCFNLCTTQIVIFEFMTTTVRNDKRHSF